MVNAGEEHHGARPAAAQRSLGSEEQGEGVWRAIPRAASLGMKLVVPSEDLPRSGRISELTLPLNSLQSQDSK